MFGRRPLSVAVTRAEPVLPAETTAVRVPKAVKLRERDFTAAEAKAILTHSLEPATGKLSPEHQFARRWIPWLCAYTGARVNEIGQLRGEDIAEHEGVWTITITPEAGRVKTMSARTIPLHSHLIEQGFLEAVRTRGTGPLFYEPARQRGTGDANRHVKKVGERIATWVRKTVGINDPHVQPSHAWRHSWKSKATEAGIEEKVSDAITGHAPTTVGRAYGHVTLSTMAEAMARFPRYKSASLTSGRANDRPKPATAKGGRLVRRQSALG